MRYSLYIKQAWQMMKHQRFFSAIYIIGTGLAISMVMVLAVVYHIRTANIAPEVNRNRTVYVDRVSYKSKDNKSTNNFGCGTRFVKEVILSLRTPEDVAITAIPLVMNLNDALYMQAVGMEKVKQVDYLPCNAGFWRVYSFHFREGKPFTEEEVEAGIHRVVITNSLARELFGRSDVVGQEVLMNDVTYTVCGVVEDVSSAMKDCYAEAYFPYTTSNMVKMTGMPGEMSASIGCLQANILLKDRGDMPELQAELNDAVKRYNATLVEGRIEVGDARANGFTLMGVDQNRTSLVVGLFLLLFLLVPALNISGLNASQIQERMEEIGIRKAFGAPSRTLFEQIFVENLALMLPGGLLGLGFSYGLVYLFRNLLLMNGEISDNLFLSVGMLLNWQVFAYAFLVCLVLNLLSSLIPVWRAVKMNAIHALNM